MARNERTGNRKSREQRSNVKHPELGYYLIVTDTEGTEKCYFDGLYEIFQRIFRISWLFVLLKQKHIS